MAAIPSVMIVSTSAWRPVENSSATRARPAPTAHTMSTLRCHVNSSAGGANRRACTAPIATAVDTAAMGSRSMAPTMAPSWIWAASPTQPSAAQIDQDARLEPQRPCHVPTMLSMLATTRRTIPTIGSTSAIHPSPCSASHGATTASAGPDGGGGDLVGPGGGAGGRGAHQLVEAGHDRRWIAAGHDDDAARVAVRQPPPRPHPLGHPRDHHGHGVRVAPRPYPGPPQAFGGHRGQVAARFGAGG